MSIYPDKKAGQLTGRFCVEVQKDARRLRARCDTLAQAKEKEVELLKLLETGEVPATRKFNSRTSRPETLAEGIEKAKGRLWHGSSSEATNYTRLGVMAAIIGPNRKLDTITTVDIDDLIATLSTRELSDATVNRYLSALHKFLSWCIEREYKLTSMPTFAWRDEDEGRIRWITHEEEAYLTAPKVDDETFHLVVKTAIQTGMRRGELLSLEEAQVTPGWAHLWDTKSNTPRSVPLTEESYDSLRWLITRGRMPTVSRLHHRWQRARKAMGLESDPWFVFHACRHTCATRYVQANVNLRVIQKLMGHKRIETTLRYAHVNDTMLTDALGTLVEHQARMSPVETRSVNGVGILVPHRVRETLHLKN